MATAAPLTLPGNEASRVRARSAFDHPPQPPAIDDDRVDRLQSQIRGHLRSSLVAGHSLSALIVDLDEGRELYASNADRALKPASNTKLFTTAVAWELLGPEYRFRTTVHAGARPDDNGDLAGDLVVVGWHDPSWSSAFYASNAFVAERLAAQLVDQGVRTVRGDVVIRGEYIVGGERFGTLNPASQRMQAAEVMRVALRGAGVRVSGTTRTEASFDVPPDATLLAEWLSPPLHVIAAPINRISHNEFSDNLMRHLGLTLGGASSYEAGAAVTAEWLGRFAQPVDGFTLNDGSGLSHGNRVTARHLIRVVERMNGHPHGDAWERTLSVAGVDGTFGGRLRGDATRGCALLKSGTINNVITSAGLVFNRADGRRYGVALLMNDVRNQPGARQVQDLIVESLASTIRRGGDRPAPPTLTAALPRDDGAIELRWAAAPAGAQRVDVWARGTHDSWHWVAGVEPTTTSLRVTPGHGRPVQYRLTAAGAGGISDPSVTLLAAAPTGGRRVLLIDGHDRWLGQPLPDNNLTQHHDMLARYAEPLAGATIGSVTAAGLATLTADTITRNHDAVVWALGRQGGPFPTFDAGALATLRDLARRGLPLLVSGSEVAWDLDARGDSGRAALREVFGARFVDDSARTSLACLPGVVPGPGRCYSFLSPLDMRIEYPDALATVEGGSACLEYLGGTGGAACVRRERAALVGFPLETVAATEDRTLLVRHLLAELGAPL